MGIWIWPWIQNNVVFGFKALARLKDLLESTVNCSSSSVCAPKHSLRATNLGAIVAGLLPVTVKKAAARLLPTLLNSCLLHYYFVRCLSSHKNVKKLLCLAQTAEEITFAAAATAPVNRKLTTTSFASFLLGSAENSFVVVMPLLCMTSW